MEHKSNVVYVLVEEKKIDGFVKVVAVLRDRQVVEFGSVYIDNPESENLFLFPFLFILIFRKRKLV